MTANLTIKRGTYHVYLSYVDQCHMRRQKWFNTELPAEGNKRKAEMLKQKIYDEWLPLLEPQNPINSMMYHPERKKCDFPPIDNSQPIVREGVLFADVLLKWVEWSRFHVQISTFQTYQKVVVGIIEPYFRPLQYIVEEISVEIIEGYHEFLRSQGRGISTIRKHNSHIACALTYAIRRGYIQFNPAHLTRMPKRFPHAIIHYYDILDLEKLFRAFKNDTLQSIVVIAAYYGFRRSEIVALEWDCIDFERKTITIRQCAYWHRDLGKIREQRIKSELKSFNSYRTLPLLEEVEYALRKQKFNNAYCKQMAGKGYNTDHENFVFVDDRGDWINIDYVSSHFSLVIKKYGLKKIRFHDLRHTFASLAHKNGVDLLTLKDWLGHADISTTTIYTHIDYGKFLTLADQANDFMPKLDDDKDLENDDPSEDGQSSNNSIGMK